jgi:hypothetical protein
VTLPVVAGVAVAQSTPVTESLRSTLVGVDRELIVVPSADPVVRDDLPPPAAGIPVFGLPATGKSDLSMGLGGFWSQMLLNVEFSADWESLPVREGSVLDLFVNRQSGASLAQAMDAARLPEQPESSGFLQVDAAGAALVSSGLSVGYVLWLARGGVLVASVMSSVPAWSSVDPLPVLARAQKKSEGDDATGDDGFDPVDKLFSGARRWLRAAPPEVSSDPPAPVPAATRAPTPREAVT